MEYSKYSTVTQEALNQLTELGVEKEKAHEALLKFDNDVNRAADFYFQSIISDDPMSNITSLTSSDNHTWTDPPRNDSESNNISAIDLTGNDTDFHNAIEASIKDHDEDDLKRGITASLKEASPSAVGNNDNNNMAVILYNRDVTKNDSNSQFEHQNNWSHCLEQPMKRVKLDTTPLGLKQIVNFGYACPFFQALFHIPVFRLAILASRPTRNNWGEVEGYWNGKSQGLSVEGESMDYYAPEFKSRPYTMKFMHEFQKLFGFLSLSQRAYGDASLLMNALAYEEPKSSWPEWEVAAQDFVTRMLDAIVSSFSYCNLIDLDSGIPDSLSKYIIPFDKLLKSVARDEIVRRYDNYHYKSEKKDEDVLNIPLEITSSYNTIYAAFDHIVRHRVEPTQKIFFTSLAKILVLNIKHRDGFTDINFTSGDSEFNIDKELYMDRYLLSRAEDVEKRWCQLGSLKSEFEEINRAIRDITEYQGRHNGSDLLKGSIDYFRRKCDKAQKMGVTDNVAQKACSFLEGALEKIEQKLKDLLEKREEIETKIKNIFNTPDMKKAVYRLKAVLVCRVHQYYAYIWVSRGNKTETISYNHENGTWWKFCDTTVEETLEEHVLKDTSGLHMNSDVYTLIYVNADVDYNFPNINDLIPPSLKEYVEKDNRMLDEEVSNDPRSQNCDIVNNDYTNSYSNNDYNDYSMVGSENIADVRDEMDISEEISIVRDSNDKIECDIDITIKQAENMGPLDPKINKRFEIFCIKLEQIELFKLLMRRYYDFQQDDVSWDEPRPLDIKYQDDPSFKGYVDLFNKYKEITLYFAEGLERMTSDEYKNAPAYFKYAIDLEKDWIGKNLVITDSKGNSVTLNGEKLQRSKEIDAFARICLKIEHDGFLGKIRSKQYLTSGLKDGLQFLPYIVGYIGESKCIGDELFKRFKADFQGLLETLYDGELNDEQKVLKRDLNEEYTRPKKSLKLKPNVVTEDDEFYKRYEANLKTISSILKKYEEISNIKI